MPLQYPQSSPYNPYTEPKKPKNLPAIILITLGIIIIIGAGIYFYINPLKSTNNDENLGDNNSGDEGIAVGEPNPSSYDCSADVYNCANFTTQSEAQVAFDSCIDKGNGDVWNLDKDGDGKVCESLA